MWTLLALRRGLDHLPSMSMVRRPFSSSPSSVSSLKRLIQPFVMKCHPDMARQQGLPDTAQKVNLAAIQNLNAYIDGVNKLLKDNHAPYPFPNEKHTVEIDFIIPMDKLKAETTQPKPVGESKKANQFVVSNSRRKLELLVPRMDMTPGKVKHHVTRQFLRLLRISDLPVPASHSLLEDEDDEEEDEGGYQHGSMQGGGDGERSTERQRRRMTPWEKSRERFWKRHKQSFDLKKFNQVYREALSDAQTHIRTKNWIRDNPRLRHGLLAKVLSNVKFHESISPLERLVAYRRLLRFMDENFDDLRLEDSGRYWEDQMTLMVAEPRPYNLSTSSLRKRRKKNMNLETGYSFTIHHDNKVTVTIPADFENNELLQELLRNMADFMQTQGTGLEGDFYSAMYGHDSII